MSAADLRRVAAMADTLLKAADSLAASESLDQALRERHEKLDRLDAEIGSRSEALRDLHTRLAAMRSTMADMEGKVEEIRSARLAEIDSATSQIRQDRFDTVGREGEALRKDVDALLVHKSNLEVLIAELRATRDTLQSEIDSAKQRVSNL